MLISIDNHLNIKSTACSTSETTNTGYTSTLINWHLNQLGPNLGRALSRDGGGKVGQWRGVRGWVSGDGRELTSSSPFCVAARVFPFAPPSCQVHLCWLRLFVFQLLVLFSVWLESLVLRLVSRWSLCWELREPFWGEATLRLPFCSGRSRNCFLFSQLRRKRSLKMLLSSRQRATEACLDSDVTRDLNNWEMKIIQILNMTLQSKAVHYFSYIRLQHLSRHASFQLHESRPHTYTGTSRSLSNLQPSFHCNTPPACPFQPKHGLVKRW